jgi:tetratricopeptide (TPR) repeat protein
MFKLKTPQYIALAIAVVVIVLLNIVPKKLDKASVPKPSATQSSNFDIAHYIDSVKPLLPKSTLASILGQETIMNSSNTQVSIKALDSIGNIWLAEKQVTVASYFKLMKASKENTAKSYYDAGSLFYKSTKFALPQQVVFCYEKAIEALKKALELEPNSLDYKTTLANCYVEGSNNPMQGITLLREVVSQDSSHLQAQISLGLFAMKSNQYEKAIARFKKILIIAPQYIEAYIYMGEAYASMGNKKEAITSCENFLSKNNNEEINSEIRNYINELKTN